MAPTTFIANVPSSLARAGYTPEQEKEFYTKSISPHTRKAYWRVLCEFFRAVKGLSPQEVTPPARLSLARVAYQTPPETEYHRLQALGPTHLF